MTKTNNNPSVTNKVLDLASIVAGAYHGYCDAKGIPLAENAELALTYGPAAIQAAVYGTKLGFVGAIEGTKFAAPYAVFANRLYKTVAIGSAGAIGGTIFGVGVGGAAGALVGGFQTLVGYGMGYLAGLVA